MGRAERKRSGRRRECARVALLDPLPGDLCPPLQMQLPPPFVLILPLCNFVAVMALADGDGSGEIDVRAARASNLVVHLWRTVHFPSSLCLNSRTATVLGICHANGAQDG